MQNQQAPTAKCYNSSCDGDFSLKFGDVVSTFYTIVDTFEMVRASNVIKIS